MKNDSMIKDRLIRIESKLHRHTNEQQERNERVDTMLAQWSEFLAEWRQFKQEWDEEGAHEQTCS